jgi:hypothetical protein
MSTKPKLILLRPWTLINRLTLRHSPRNGFINPKAACCCGRWMKASSETSESKKGRCSCFLVSPHIAIWDTGINNLSVANTPHNPVRFENTIGLVVERVRPEGSLGMVFHYLTSIFYTDVTMLDRLRWYCSSPSHEEPTIIREDSFHVTDLGTQLKPVIERWMNDANIRTCKICGTVADAK